MQGGGNDLTTLDWIKQEKLIAIVRGIKSEQLLPLARALYDGGVKVMEVAYSMKDDDAVTADSIRALCEQMKDRMCIGSGTVLSSWQAELTHRAGGKFIVSPDTCVEVIRKTKELGMVSIPGALTPTEAMKAYRAGADIIKLFPIASLGTSYVKAIKAPLSGVQFAAVGGVNLGNIPEYRKAGIECFGVGSNLVDKKALAAGDYAAITAIAEKYTETMHMDL